MSAFSTDGIIEIPAEIPGLPDNYGWGDLDPFTQGCVEELLEKLNRMRLTRLEKIGAQRLHRPKGFSDLAPETLAAILKDCAARQRHHPTPLFNNPRETGKLFWRWRQEGLPNFPPLTVYLGDDGKVYLREGASK